MASQEVGIEYTSKGLDAMVSGAQKGNTALRSVGETAGQSAEQLSAFDRIAAGAMERVGQALTNGAAQAAGAMAKFVGDSIGAAGNFEAGMNRFGAVIGDNMAASGQSLESFSKLFLQLGQDTQFSAAQAQDAAINLAKGGIDAATIASGGLKAALDLAAAGELDLAAAADITAKQYGVWVDKAASAGEKSAFLAQSANLLAQAANTSTVNVDDLALGLANAGGSAKNAGLSFQDTVTSIGLIASSFSSGADAGTSFKTFVARLIPTSDAATKEMIKLGLATADGTSKFYDAQGSFIGMQAASELLKGSLEGVSEAERNKSLSIIFGQDAIRTAAKLAEEGAAGFQTFAASMTAAGSASDQAAARQQGYNFAMEQVGGSVETLQITLGQLLLPALTAVLNGGILPMINGMTQFFASINEGTSWVNSLASVVQGAFVPALMGATVALVAFGVANAGTVGIALALVINQIGTATIAFGAHALAVAAAAALYVVMGAAVAGVAYIITDFNNKISEGTQKLLEGKQWWTESAAALETYTASQTNASVATQSAANTLTALREQMVAETEALAQEMALGQLSQDEQAARLARLNELAGGIRLATDNLNAQMQAEMAAAASSMTATSALASMGDASSQVAEKVALSADQIEKLSGQLDKVMSQGAQAVGSWVQTETQFLSDAQSRREQYYSAMEAMTKEKEGATTAAQIDEINKRMAETSRSYREQEAAQAQSYAAQQAAQRAHLGSMLIEYTNTQAALGNIEKGRAAELTGALAREYGIRADSSAVLFAQMAGHIDQFASNANASVDSVVGDLQRTQADAVATEQKMQALAKDYTVKVVDNFAEKKMTVEEYSATLQRVPDQVATAVENDADSAASAVGGYIGELNRIPREVTTTLRKVVQQVGEDSDADSAAKGKARASGGPVKAGDTYVVGEEGPELFVPKSAGTIIPNDQAAGKPDAQQPQQRQGTVSEDRKKLIALQRIESQALDKIRQQKSDLEKKVSDNAGLTRLAEMEKEIIGYGEAARVEEERGNTEKDYYLWLKQTIADLNAEKASLIKQQQELETQTNEQLDKLAAEEYLVKDEMDVKKAELEAKLRAFLGRAD